METRFSRKMWNVISLAIVLALVFAPLAIASDVDVAVVDVTAPTGSVTLVPGGSASIVINMSVTGKQEGTATFEVYRDWTLSGGTFTGSNPEEFTVGPRAGGDPATTFSTSGTVTVAAGQTDGTFTLAVGAFDITNSNATGAKLDARDSSSYQVTVEAPACTYKFEGFFQPVEMDKLNTVKGGSTVPLKFRLWESCVEGVWNEIDDAMEDITLEVRPQVCDKSAQSSPLEEIATGSTSLRYDDGKYIYNWKTVKGSACYEVSVHYDQAKPLAVDFETR